MSFILRCSRGRSWPLMTLLAAGLLSCGESRPAAPRVGESSSSVATSDGNSAFTAELKGVSKVGFLDGTTCERWPIALSLERGGRPLGALSDAVSEIEVFFPEHRTIFDRAAELGIRDLNAIGSKHRLRVEAMTLDTGESSVVAFDPETKVAFAIDHRWLCAADEAREDFGAEGCDVASISHSVYGSLSLLRRNAPRDQPAAASAPPAGRIAKAVVLAAPSIEIPEDITVDVDLIAVAEEITTGHPQVSRASITARSAGYATPYDARVSPATVPNWRAAVSNWAQPSLVIVACRSCAGLDTVSADFQPRVEEINITGGSSTRVFTDGNGIGRLEIPAKAFYSVPSEPVPLTVAGTEPHPGRSPGSLPTEWSHESPFCFFASTNYGAIASWQRGRVRIDLPSLPTWRDSVRGGAASVHCDENCAGRTATAVGSDSVWFNWNDATVLAEIRAELDRHVPKYNCELTTAPPCSFGFCTCELDCDDIMVDLCFGSSCRSFYWDGQASTIDAVAEHMIAETRRGLPTSIRSGQRGVAQMVGDSFWAANLYSRGLLAQQQAASLENRSLRVGVTSSDWSILGDSLRDAPSGIFDPADPTGPTFTAWLETGFNIKESFWEDVLAQEGNALRSVDFDVFPNAVGMPAGRVAASWRRTSPAVGEASKPLTSINDLQENWRTLAQLIADINDSAQQANNTGLISSVIRIGGDQLGVVKGLSTSLREAANTNRVDQQVVVERLVEAQSDLISLRDEYIDAVMATWECESVGLEGCAAIMQQGIEALKNECTKKSVLDSMFNLLLDLVSGLTIFVDTVDVLDFVVAQFEISDALRNSDLGDVLSFIKESSDQISKGIKIYKRSKDYQKNVTTLLGEVESSCTPGEQANIRGYIQSILNYEAITSLLDSQLLVHANVLQSIAADIGYLAALEGIADATILDAEAVEAKLNNLDVRRTSTEYFEAACGTARSATRAGLRDLHYASALLETTTGRPDVSAKITVPGLDGQPDLSTGFLYSIWDEGRYRTTFGTDGAGATSPTVDVIADRFETAVSQTLCRDNENYAAPRFLVRKRITGNAFDRFLSTGRVDFDITLDDILLAGETAENKVSAVLVEGLSNSSEPDKPLASPVVLDVSYALCDDTTCDLDGTQLPFPYLVKSSRGQVASGVCSPADLPDIGTIPIAAWGGDYAETCLRSVSTERVTAKLTWTDGNAIDETIVDSSLGTSVCIPVETSVVQLTPVRGMPAFGGWTLAWNLESARRIAEEFKATTEPVAPPPSDYLESAPTANAVTVLIVVGAQHPGSGQEQAYRRVGLCGNSIVQSSEQCDDGNTFNNDGCSSTCQNEFCGDGVTQASEQCDDGNQVSNDGCSAACTVESSGQRGEPCNTESDCVGNLRCRPYQVNSPTRTCEYQGNNYGACGGRACGCDDSDDCNDECVFGACELDD